LKEEDGFSLLEGLVVRTTNSKVRRFAKIALDDSAEYLRRNALPVADETLDDLEG